MPQPTRNALHDYLDDEHKHDKGELKRIEKQVGEIWPLFFRSLHPVFGWPYEISETSLRPKLKNISFSTTSMVLYAIGLGIGRIHNGPLCAGVDKHINVEGRDELSKAFEKGLKQLVTETVKNKGQPALFTSGSFGKDDPLTLSWVLELMRTSQGNLGGEFRKLVLKKAKTRLSDIFKKPHVVCIMLPSEREREALDHVFPLLRALQAYRSLGLNGSLNPKAKARFDTGLQQTVREFIVGRLHLQLSLSSIPDSTFDPAELVFALEALLLTDTPFHYVDKATIEKFFRVVHEIQARSPYWRPLKPFIKTASGMALLPLSVEIANSLLRICSYLDQSDDTDDYFSKHRLLFSRYADWLFSRVARLKTPGRDLVGWHSEHVHVPKKIHPWETAQVTLFLLCYAHLLQAHVANRCVRTGNFTIKKVRKSNKQEWKTEMLPKEPLLGLADAASVYRIYSRLLRNVVETEASDKKRIWSALLYGPPGTGKTGVALNLAKSLGWPLLTITPSDFVGGGESEVETRAKAIFEALMEQEEIVILLDEIDRLILDRDASAYNDQSDLFQFMTPSMLVKLKDLRERAKCLFLIGTNYADRIDPAAKRVGRVDEQLLVCPPDKLQRAAIFKNLLQPAALKTKVLDKFLLNGEVLKKTALATYDELKKLVNDALAASKNGDAVLELVSEKCAKLSPSIRLATYRGRFDSKKWAQFPFDEFFILCYLKIEVCAMTENDTELLVETIDKLKNSGDTLSSILADAQIVSTIESTLSNKA